MLPELRHAERLEQITIRSCAERFCSNRRIVQAGDHHDLRLGPARLCSRDQFDPGLTRKTKVRDDYIVFGHELIEAGDDIDRFIYIKALTLQIVGDEAADLIIVFHNEHPSVLSEAGDLMRQQSQRWSGLPHVRPSPRVVLWFRS